jgi:ribonuclease Z
MGSDNLVKLELDDYVLEGYSVAGEETVVAVPNLNVCFDIGKAPDSLLNVDHVLISHSHMDHVANLAYYFSQRDFREMAPGTVLLPQRLAGLLEELLDFWGRFDGSRPPATIIPMIEGQQFEIRRNLFARAFKTNHTWDSLGYTIIDQRKKLKSEYLDLPGPEIARLRRGGTEVTNTTEVPLVTYLGDTMGGDFEKLDFVCNSKILITECTFFDPEHRERARAGRHYHFDDLAHWLEKINCEHIVLTHLSRRTRIGLAKKKLRRVLPEEIARKIHFLMDRYYRRPEVDSDR